MATPAAASKQTASHEHAEVHHHLSPYPILVGLGAFLLYIGAALELPRPGIVFGIGLVLFLYALAGWVREDVQFWREKRPAFGVQPGGRDVGWWGMVFFLGTEVMLFGGLFATFFAQRSYHPEAWAEAREHLSHALTLVSINTVVLLSSGATMHYALHSIQKDNRRGLVVGLVATIFLGAVFLGVQVSEYLSLIESGITIGSGPFGSIFYMLTGTHGFHVFLGLVFLGMVLVRGLLGQFDAERHVAVDAFAIYWHFVDVVWIIVFLTVYLGVI